MDLAAEILADFKSLLTEHGVKAKWKSIDLLVLVSRVRNEQHINGVSPRGFTYGLYCYVLWNTQGHGKTYKIPISRGGLPCDGAW